MQADEATALASTCSAELTANEEAAREETADPPDGPTYGRGRGRRLDMYESLDAPPWSECERAPRPCTRRCRYRLPGPEATCAIDVAEIGGMTLDEVASVLGGDLTRERIRQIEEKAIRKLAGRLRLRGLSFDDLRLHAPTEG